MSDTIKLLMAQYDFLVGDIKNNADKIIQLSQQARLEHQADIIVFPELTLTSYPPEDLLLRPGLYQQIDAELARIVRAIEGIYVVFGYPCKVGESIYNCASVIYNGNFVASYYKQELPNYSVFDEKRYFSAGKKACVFDLSGIKVGLTICEDIWVSYPLEKAKAAGAELVININASPFHHSKFAERLEVLKNRCSEVSLPVIYTNLVGGQDELVFDGRSMAVNAQGDLQYCAPEFVDGLFPVEFTKNKDKVEVLSKDIAQSSGFEATVYAGICRAVRDYVLKNHFNGVVIGLSGGVDSALTLAIAVDALGADNVEVIMMPSPYTAGMSLEDAQQQAKTVNVAYHQISIKPIFEIILQQLYAEFPQKEAKSATITEENVQARARGLLLMAYSNLSGRMVLTTGNKSEMSVGYATLYGDMAGGFAPLKDVPKTLVYRLANYRNGKNQVIPQRVLDRAPSAELSPDQKDEDSLPPYDILDDILRAYVELDLCPEQIIAQGHDAQTVWKVAKLVDINEYKRRQAPPGVRITPRAFGRERRYPITSGYQSK